MFDRKWVCKLKVRLANIVVDFSIVSSFLAVTEGLGPDAEHILRLNCGILHKKDDCGGFLYYFLCSFFSRFYSSFSLFFFSFFDLWATSFRALFSTPRSSNCEPPRGLVRIRDHTNGSRFAYCVFFSNIVFCAVYQSGRWFTEYKWNRFHIVWIFSF